ncbi:MAG: nickel-dependent hydrogenase large subunit [Candidatus Thiodiazotropha sp.]
MNVEGEILIELYRSQGRVEKVAIRSSRPLQLTAVFEGKSVNELLRVVPMLYSVCATAQACAAAQACRQAMALNGDIRVEFAEKMLVDVETAREHLWRLLIDWSNYAEEPVDSPLVSSLSTLLPAAKSACFGEGGLFTLEPALSLDGERFESVIERLSKAAAEAVFSMPPAEWYAIDTAEMFDRWLDQTSTAPAKLLRRIRDRQTGRLADAGANPLPSIDPLALCRRLGDEDAEQFVATPDWMGARLETTSLTRMVSHPLLQNLSEHYGFGLMTRLTARLLELAAIPGRLSDQLEGLRGDRIDTGSSGSKTGVGEGLSEVEAARGRLIHRAVVEQGKIAKYQILAPTEWNFHPRGMVAKGLLSLPAVETSQLKAYADLFINTVDPCVGYRLEVV